MRFRDLIKAQLSNNKEAAELYKGCSIMYSSLEVHPPFLFIGINPGAGTPDDEHLAPGEGFEYINAKAGGYDYTLAKETREVFEAADLLDLLSRSAKTNIYYFITRGTWELSALASSLGDDVSDQFHQLAVKWTCQIIDMIKPKIIVCEGMSVIKTLSAIFKIDIIKEGSCGYFELNSGVLVVAYARRRSYIRDKRFVADFLKGKVTPIVRALAAA